MKEIHQIITQADKLTQKQELALWDYMQDKINRIGREKLLQAATNPHAKNIIVRGILTLI